MVNAIDRSQVFCWQYALPVTSVILSHASSRITSISAKEQQPSGLNCMKTRKKHAVNKKNSTNILEVERKDVTLHRNSEINLNVIGIWCNGNTADSGPAFPGSSPGIPTKRNLLHGKFLFLLSATLHCPKKEAGIFRCLPPPWKMIKNAVILRLLCCQSSHGLFGSRPQMFSLFLLP